MNNKLIAKKESFLIKSLFLSLLITALYIGIFLLFTKDYIELLKQPANSINKYGVTTSVIIFFAVQIIGFIVHEIIHGMFSILFTKDIKSIKFGIAPKQMMFYCHCLKPLYVNHYLIMVIAPFIMMGLTPFVLGLYFENLFAIFFGYVFSVAAIGDLYIIYLVFKNYQKKYIQDSASDIGGEYIEI
ncbi:DUF3267 domain-containing protein [Chryseobacterium gleum]|uniref:DUF3267 domain-containing protein n=1 Tax=Chryseobacterium gleum TaxID=250 RepID=UPI0031D693B0